MIHLFRIRTIWVLCFLLFATLDVKSQQIIRLNDTSSHHFSGSYLLDDDTLELKYSSNLNHQQLTGKENFLTTKVIRGSNLNNTNDILVDTNFLSIVSHKFSIGGSLFVEIGDKFPLGNRKRGNLWIRNDLIQRGAIVNEPYKDTLNEGVYLKETFLLGHILYAFGQINLKEYPYRKAFILKYNIKTNQLNQNSYYCYASFCSIHNVIYDSLNGNFIAISTARLGNTIAPNGAGIAKIDTNLNLVPNTAHAMEVHHNYYSWDTGHYNYTADIAWVTDSTFLAAGTVTNPRQFPSQTPNPNPAYHNDIAVALRSSDSLKEINDPKKFGKVDTSERTDPDGFILEKIDSNLFVAVTNSRYYNYMPEPWNTSLALFGLDANGDKHWEYYMPYKDYCWAKEVHPTTSGGLWVTAQCSGDLNRQAGTYEYFVKVAYIDSIAHWPRNPSTVGVNEIQKKAKEFVVYPNPTNNNLKIKQYGLIAELNYELYDQSGRLVKSQISAEHQVELNLQDLAKGFYILSITDRSGKLIKTEKVVKQ